MKLLNVTFYNLYNRGCGHEEKKYSQIIRIMSSLANMKLHVTFCTTLNLSSSLYNRSQHFHIKLVFTFTWRHIFFLNCINRDQNANFEKKTEKCMGFRTSSTVCTRCMHDRAGGLGNHQTTLSSPFRPLSPQPPPPKNFLFRFTLISRMVLGV